jgi:hypothetical protein
MGAHAALELSHRGRAVLRCRRRHEEDKGLQTQGSIVHHLLAGGATVGPNVGRVA